MSKCRLQTIQFLNPTVELNNEILYHFDSVFLIPVIETLHYETNITSKLATFENSWGKLNIRSLNSLNILKSAARPGYVEGRLADIVD